MIRNDLGAIPREGAWVATLHSSLFTRPCAC